MSTLSYFLALCGFIWCLAVYKVFNSDNAAPTIVLVNNDAAVRDVRPLTLNATPRKNVKTKIFRRHDSEQGQLLTRADTGAKLVPKSSEWIFIRSSKTYKIESNQAFDETGSKVDVLSMTKPQQQQAVQIAPASQELHWPPVQQDGSIAVADGEDTMPLIGLKVPKFWAPANKDTDLNTVGSKVNGEETIFLMIASYRDFQCRETITSAFSRADHPERLFVAAVDQTVPGDVGCLDIEIPCSVDASQPICKYRDQISIYHMDAQYATGPVTARHVGDRMYRGEYFVMQMDAHCLFVRHWDTQIIGQWRYTNNEMAVLRFATALHLLISVVTFASIAFCSSYLSDVQGSISPAGDSLRNTRPIMCNRYSGLSLHSTHNLL